MKTRHSIGLILGITIIILGSFAIWFTKSRESHGENPASGSLSIDPLLFSTAKPAHRTFTLQVPCIGKAESDASIELIAPISGRIDAIKVEDQNLVEKDQAVMQLGGPRIEDKRDRLTIEIESLDTQVQLVRETVVDLERNLKAQLASKDQVAVAQEEKTRLEMQLKEAQLSLQTLDNQRIITAPIKGIFTDRLISTGQSVNAGQVVGKIIDADHLRIVASLFLPDGVELLGKEAVVRLTANHNVTGKVTKIVPQASRTGAVTAWIEGPLIDTNLHPGQMVEGQIAVELRSNTLAVPESAIVYDSEDRPCLFVLNEDTYERLAIQTGMEQDGWIEIISGLNPDQIVVVSGAYELFYRDFDKQFKVQD